MARSSCGSLNTHKHQPSGNNPKVTLNISQKLSILHTHTHKTCMCVFKKITINPLKFF